MNDRRRALVTGASKRMGRAMALELARSGWDVAIHYNGSQEAAEATAADARALGVTATTLKAEFGRDTEIERLVPDAADQLGGALSLLINNASTFRNDEVGSITSESWNDGMDSNLRAPVMLTQAFAAQAPKARIDARGEPVAQSVVINILDQRVLKPTPFFSSYLLAKSALMAFTRSSAQALAPHIRVGAIGPGPTIIGSRQSDEHFANQRSACILGRGSDPEDIIGAMQFILSNKAFTGQMLAIDGGQHLIWQTPDIQGSVE